MTHLGTYEAGSDWDWVLTLQDQDGSTLNLTSATVVASVERNGALYSHDVSVTKEGDADDQPVTFSVTKAISRTYPAGLFRLIIESTESGVSRVWRHTFRVNRWAGA